MLAHPAIFWCITTDLVARHRYGPIMRPRKHNVTVAKAEDHIVYPAYLRRALHDGIEDRLHVGGRAADDAERLGRRRLMFQRLAQLRVALAEFFEQADIFNGDDGLVGEGLQKGDLFFSKKTDLGAANLNRADWNAFAKQRRNQNRARAGHLLAGFGVRIFGVKQRQNVVNVNRFAIDDSAAGGRSARKRALALSDRHRTIYRYMLEDVAIDAIDQDISRVAQPRGRCGNFPNTG